MKDIAHDLAKVGGGVPSAIPYTPFIHMAARKRRHQKFLTKHLPPSTATKHRHHRPLSSFPTAKVATAAKGCHHRKKGEVTIPKHLLGVRCTSTNDPQVSAWIH